MILLETIVMLLRWKAQGWEVHPIMLDEFAGWV
jgi:hypothetical protein